MKKHLLKIIGLTFVYSCLITTVLLASIIALRPIDYSLRRDDMSGLAYGIAIGLIVLLTIGSIPILFNVYKSVREKYSYSFLSFFCLPIIITIVSLCLMGDILDSIKEYTAMLLPYFGLLTFHFYKFRRQKLYHI